MKQKTKFLIGIFMLSFPFIYLIGWILFKSIQMAIHGDYCAISVLAFGTWMTIGARLCAKNAHSKL